MKKSGRIRVLQVGKYYYPYKGGMENYLYNICMHLKDDIDLEVVVANTENRTVVEDYEGIKVTRLASLGTIASTSICPGFPAFLRKADFDILHFHCPNPMTETSLLLSGNSARILVTYQHEIIKQKILKKLYRNFHFTFLKKSSLVLAHNPIFIKSSPVLSKMTGKCRVLPLGISLESFKQGGGILNRKKYIDKFGSKNIVFIGRFIYYKGVEYLIRAMKDIDANLHLIGSGPLLKDYRRIITEKKLENRVFFHIDISDEEKVELLQMCTIFVLPSVEKTEAFGLVQIEAMACGKPVISTDIPGSGVPWVNKHNETGFVIPPKNSRALHDAINYLLNNPAVAEKLGFEGRRRAESEFDIEIHTDKLRDIYHELVRE